MPLYSDSVQRRYLAWMESGLSLCINAVGVCIQTTAFDAHFQTILFLCVFALNAIGCFVSFVWKTVVH